MGRFPTRHLPKGRNGVFGSQGSINLPILFSAVPICFAVLVDTSAARCSGGECSSPPSSRRLQGYRPGGCRSAGSVAASIPRCDRGPPSSRRRAAPASGHRTVDPRTRPGDQRAVGGPAPQAAPQPAPPPPPVSVRVATSALSRPPRAAGAGRLPGRRPPARGLWTRHRPGVCLQVRPRVGHVRRGVVRLRGHGGGV